MSHALTFVRPISDRGQIVVPKDIRRRLGIRNEVVFEVHADRVEMRASGDHCLKEFFSLPRQPKSPSPATLKQSMLERHADLH